MTSSLQIAGRTMKVVSDSSVEISGKSPKNTKLLKKNSILKIAHIDGWMFFSTNVPQKKSSLLMEYM